MREEVYHQYAQDLRDGHWWVSHRRQLFDTWLSQCNARRSTAETTQPSQVLELGSGVGTEWSYLSTLGAVTGVELSPVGVRYCEQRGYARLLNADINGCDFGTNVYDFAVDFHVLYHTWIRDPGDVLLRLFAALRPGGYLLLSEPAYKILARSHDDVVMAARRWDRRELLELVAGAGFRVERWSGMLAPVAPVALALAAFDRFRTPAVDITELKQGSRFAENVLRGLLRCERAVVRHASVPFGTCWAVLARKPTTLAREPTA